MRVTKLIRDYVTENVKKAYADRIAAIGSEYREETEKLNALIEEIANEANEKVKSILPDGYSRQFCKDTDLISFYHASNKSKQDEISQAKRKLESERDTKIRDILVNIELGATRADLDEMLKNI